MLSIGTGYDLAPKTPTESIPRRGIQGFLQRLIGMGEAAILEDMNCETLWQEFREGLGADGSTKERLKRYKRLNPPLEGPIPDLDDIDQMGNLQKKVENYVHGNQEINETASSLIGTLFYFELQSVVSKVSTTGVPYLACEGK